MTSYDFVLVAGSAGCVLANRLRAHRGTRVLVLEADSRAAAHMPHHPPGPPRAAEE